MSVFPAPQPVPPSDLIARAAHQGWLSLRAAVARKSHATDSRSGVIAVDEILDLLEQKHLIGDRNLDRVIRFRLRELERRVGLPLPRKVARARNTVRLHSALLDWQEQLLDEVRPSRLEYPDVHDQDWNATEDLGYSVFRKVSE